MAVLEQDLHHEERRRQHEAQLRAEDELLAMVLALSLAEDASGRIQQEAEMALPRARFLSGERAAGQRDGRGRQSCQQGESEHRSPCPASRA
ncbi:RCHY1 [Symbiodinium sp. KB8]|nr:RCHY1 [Symbiodinium sp. KB8]